MGLNDEYLKLRKKRLEEEEEEEERKSSSKQLAPLFVNKTAALYKVSKKNEDIAPVRTTSKKKDEEEERKWFEKGAFEDGYQFGDVTKTILGTVTDTVENVGAGIIGMGEKAVDSLTQLGAWSYGGLKQTPGIYAGSVYSFDMKEREKAMDEAAEFIAKDLYDEEKVAKKIISAPIKSVTGIDAEEDSVFGEKTDALAQSGGQLLATAGLQAVGVPWFVTTGVTAYGSELENAYKEGATFEEAGTSALISAGAEILTEKLSGGISFGGKTADEVLTKQIARGISNKTLRTMAKLGLDAVGEGGEEIVSQVFSNLGSALYKEESVGELLTNEQAMDEYLESFIGGAVLGGVSGGVNAAKSAKKGVDYASGLTKNEQAVVDKLYKDRVAEEGNKGKSKAKIYDEILEDMEKGYISTDTIEEVLGGDTFKSYKDTIDSEEKLQQEYEELGKKQNATLAEQTRYQELHQQMQDIKESSKRSELKTKLGEEVFGLVQNDRLLESYNERGRKSQAFKTDLTQYDTKYHDTIKKAAESGILNDTRRTHEFVDMIAKISADKGVLFDFTNNEKLKNSGFAVDGKQVNGFVTKDGVTLNIDSAKSLNSVVGHEITHVLEGTELYDALQKAVIEYARGKKDYQSRVKALSEVYKDVEGADISKELTADLIGDYLFNDTDFINNLSTGNRNVFEKIYDEIKYLAKVATAGSKEARELAKVQRAFENAYRESGKQSENSDGAKYSFSGKNAKTANYLTLDEAIKMEDVGQATSEEIRQQTGWFKGYDGKWRFEISDRDMEFNIKGFLTNPDVIRYKELENKFIDDPENMTEAEESELRSLQKNLKGVKKTPRNLGDYIKHDKLFEAYPQLKDIVVRFAILPDGTFGAYDSSKNEIVLNYGLRDNKAKIEDTLIHEIQHAVQHIEGFATGSSPEYWESKRRDIVDTISGARKNLDLFLEDIGYSEFVKKSMQEVASKEKTLDEHWEDCAEFKANSKYAEQIAICEAEIAEYQRQYDEITNGMTPFEQYQNTAGEIEARDAEKRRWRSEEARKERRPDIDRTDVVFADTRYSLSDSDGKQLSPEQQEYFKDSKMRDENGNLKVMYHGSTNAGFHVFDPKMSDDYISMFFVDRNDVAATYSGSGETYEAKAFRSAEDANNFFAEIGMTQYEVQEKDGKYTLYDDGDEVATSESLSEIYDEFRDWEGVGYGDANYKVYLNLTNPLEVDAKGRNWNNISREYSQEIADRYHSLTAEEKAALADIAGWGEYGIFRDEMLDAAKVGAAPSNLTSAYKKLGGANANLYDAFSIASDNFSEEAIKQFAMKQMKTRDYAQRAKEQGYDGVIFKNIVDNGGYSNGSEGASTVAIAFDSEQIKSIANDKPTRDKDIRFSLSKPVEETKNLVALHNLTADKLTKSLQLGGLPMPSLAVTKADVEHSNFGEITLIFGKDTIDPKKNKKNKVYSADAWTPVFPRVEYEADSEISNRIMRKLNNLAGSIDDTFHRDIRLLQGGFDDYLNSEGGEEGLIQRVLGNYGLKAAYLEEQGKHVDKVTMQKEAEKQYNPDAAEKYLKIMDVLGVTTAEEIGEINLKDAKEQHGAELEAIYPGITKTAFRMSRIFTAVRSYIENKDSAPVYNTVTDISATKNAVDEALDAEGYEAWVRELFTGIEKDSGIYNNKGWYTPSGNRRSFKQTHLPVTLENIVKAMAGQNNGNAKNVSGFNGVKTLRAATAETFKSVEQMHQRKDRLQNRTQEEANALNDALQDRLFKVIDTIDNESGKIGDSNPYIRFDSIGEILTEIGESGKFGIADIQRVFQQYRRTVSDDTALEVKQLLYDVQQMPVDLFEAKPERVVGFDEAKVFVIPNNADAKLKQELLNRGYSIAEYDPNVEGDRQKVVNQFEEYKFSLSREGEQFAPVGRNDVFGRDIALEQDIAPVAEDIAPNVTEAYEAITPKKEKEPKLAKATPVEQVRAKILTEEPESTKKKSGAWAVFKDNFVDKGTIVETISLKTGNRELQARFKSIGRAESRAQWFMEHGNAATSSLKSIRETVESSGKTAEFYEYLYHLHNADRMSLEERFEGMENKPVIGYDVTADMSKETAAALEKANPEFKEYAQEVYGYMTHLRQMLVDGGVISEDTAKLWEKMYPHYVPVRRKGDEGLNINVALDTRRTGVNAPVKKATGGNRDILPLFDTMAMRTEQTFKAVAKNRFGVELKNILGTELESEAMDVDAAIESIDTQEELLQEGKNGRNPTFTVFENGEKVTFEIDDEMYDTMKPKNRAYAQINNSPISKGLQKANDIRRGLITEYNPAFMFTNPIKDIQDVLINSQHPARTYANIPKAISELWNKNGHWYQEYMENGGEQNTYFDDDTKTFAKEKSGLAKVIGFPLERISAANNFIERIPRMAEYIASREEGRSIDVAMLDAARVTTDFSAGGDVVKLLNRNGFTFLNASVQGAAQQVRNVREAKYEGLKGWAKLAAKVTAAGLPALLLNHLLWDDDEDYAELSDYVKQNYYIVAKYGDGKFVRIPKGRTLAVIQDAFEQMENLVTGNDEVDLRTFGELVVSNLAPNNPLENNIIAPITQAIKNKAWYGDDLVPTRLQDLPAAEQFDESTDSVSRWLGEKLNISPYKINYILDQYSGGVGDAFLPMLTPEAEKGNKNALGNLIAPLRDKFTTDAVMNNQNVSDFYDTKDELTVNANASGATDEDVLMSKYMNSVSAELGKLYGEKREIQNSDLSDAEKYDAVREIQKQIIALTKESLNTYEDIRYEDDHAIIGDRYYKKDKDGEWQKLSDDQVTKYEVTSDAGDAPYASDGEHHYRWYEPGEDSDAEAGWRKITDEQLDKQKEVTSALGITPEEYWGKKEEYDYAYEYPGNYAVAKAVGGYDSYKAYTGELYDIKADKDANGKSISGSRKEKVADYINNLDADYYTKIILFKNEYNADDTYNYEIIDYLNGRDDISFEEMTTILKKLGFEVDAKGNISW